MAVDKGLSPFPLNGDGPNDVLPGVEVNDVLPPEGMAEETRSPEGNLIVDLDPQPERPEGPEDFYGNLAEHVEDQELARIGKKVCEWVDADDRSRSDWKKTYTDGLELLGFKIEERSDPWEGACGVFHPVLIEAIVRFQSQAIMETFPASGPVKTKIVGKWTREKEDQAKRVQQELNYQVCDVMTEFRPETEVLYFYLAAAGSGFRKTYFDSRLNRPTSLFVPAEDFIVPYGASDLRTCPRYTHVMREFLNDLRKDMKSGFYREVELNKPAMSQDEVQKEKDKIEGRSPDYNNDERYVLYECHCDLDILGFEDLDDEGEPTCVELPYIVTVEKNSQKVLAIRRNWQEDDQRQTRLRHFTQYTYLPGPGFYGYGLIHLIGGIAKSATSLTRQLVDAGTLSNLPGGLKTRGLRIKGDDTPIMPGEFRDVDVPSGSIRDNITFIPYKEPSLVLSQLLQDIIAEGRRLGAAPDLPINAMTQQAPVGTTLALLERSMKVMSAVQARLHASLKADFELIAQCIADNMGPKYQYEVDKADADRVEDFKQVAIIPVSDPNAASMAQRVVQYQAALELAARDPLAFDKPQLYRDMLTILGIPNVDKIVKDAENIQPMDPVAENMAIITGKPVKAFLWQDHEAHIKTHLAAIHDPKIAQMVGQSPQAALISGAAAAHISEHLAFAYRAQIEKQMGVPLPPPDEPLPDEVEVQLSKLVAEAAERVLGKDIQEMQAQRNQALQQDPIVQMQMREVAAKEAEVKRKADADKLKATVDVMKIQATRQDAQLKAASAERVAGANLGVKIAETKERLTHEDKDRALDTAFQIADLIARAEELRSRETIAKEQAKAQAARAKKPSVH